jgi:hypothetical protein
VMVQYSRLQQYVYSFDPQPTTVEVKQPTDSVILLASGLPGTVGTRCMFLFLNYYLILSKSLHTRKVPPRLCQSPTLSIAVSDSNGFTCAS